MDVVEIAPSLWRWTAYHDEWKEDVGCVYCETEDGTVLIDPLVPPEESARFLDTLDREVAGQQVHILVTIFWHARSTALLHERYGARVWAPTSARAVVTRRSGVVTDAFKPGDRLPGGIEAFRTARSSEVVYWIPQHAALVPGDVLLGDGAGGVRMCPESWLPAKTTHGALGESLRPLTDLAIESILVSHGEPVLRDGRKALAAAIGKSS
jgi:glyoxylase-like metal-dependent hydrolase (beta-lactamase superfamily II)